MNKYQEIYAHLTPDGSFVNRAIENAKTKKIKRFPVRRVTAIAACFLIAVLAVGIPIYAVNHQTALSSMASYDAAMSEEKNQAKEENSVEAYGADPENGALDGSASGSTGGSSKSGSGGSSDSASYFSAVEYYACPVEGERLSSSNQGLTVTAEEGYYDCIYMLISFSAEYTGELKGVDRFDYTFTDEDPSAELIVNDKSYLPAYGAFYLVDTGDMYAGVLTIVIDEANHIDELDDRYPYDVRLSVPSLTASVAEGEEIGELTGPFEFSFEVPYTDADMISNEAISFDSAKENTGAVEPISLRSTPAGTQVQYRIKEDYAADSENIRVALIDQSSGTVEFISAEKTALDDGSVYAAAYFAPLSSDGPMLVFYDGNTVIGRFEDIPLTPFDSASWEDKPSWIDVWNAHQSGEDEDLYSGSSG